MPTPEQWFGDTPSNDKYNIEKSLNRSLSKAESLDKGIAQLTFEVEQMRQQIAYLDQYILEHKEEEDKGANTLLSKIRNLIHDCMVLTKLYNKSIIVSSEDYDPKDFDSIEGQEDDEEIVEIFSISHKEKHESDEEMLHNLKNKIDSINDELFALGESFQNKFPKMAEEIKEQINLAGNKSN